jgi:hypothetical protein
LKTDTVYLQMDSDEALVAGEEYFVEVEPLQAPTTYRRFTGAIGGLAGEYVYPIYVRGIKE